LHSGTGWSTPHNAPMPWVAPRSSPWSCRRRAGGHTDEPVVEIHLLQRALLSARFPWSAPFDNRRTLRPAHFSHPPPQIDQRRHVPRDAPFSAAHETTDRDDPPRLREQRVDRTCRLRRFRGQRATCCDAGQSEHRLRGHSREARWEKVAFKAASRHEHESIALSQPTSSRR